MSVELSVTERLDLWIAALRSGQYRQGCGSLCETIEYPFYCCMGVFGRISGAEDAYLRYPSPVESTHWWPFHNVRVRSPVNEMGRISKGESIHLNPMCQILNDVSKWSFNEIADWLDTEARPYIEALDKQETQEKL